MALKTSLCCHLEGFDGSGCKGGEKVPLVSQMQRKFGLSLYSLGYSTGGQITLLDCKFTWPKAKLDSPQSVGTGMARAGDWRLDLHIPGFPGEGKASAACGGKESSGFLCKFFDLISCCCSVSLMVSGAVTGADAALQTENEKAVCVLSGTKQVLAGSCSCALLPEHSRAPVMLVPGCREGLRLQGLCQSREPS